MKGRLIGNYVAIAPDFQNENHVSKSGIILANGKTPYRFLTGTVLSKGSRVPEDIEVGQTVVYEKQSAHPGQTGPIDASIFGGNKDDYCVIIPVYKRALQSVADIEEEFSKHEVVMNSLKFKKESGVEFTEEDWQRVEFHDRRMTQLSLLRRGRARGYQRKSTGDTAKGSGVVAILERGNS